MSMTIDQAKAEIIELFNRIARENGAVIHSIDVEWLAMPSSEYFNSPLVDTLNIRLSVNTRTT